MKRSSAALAVCAGALFIVAGNAHAGFAAFDFDNGLHPITTVRGDAAVVAEGGLFNTGGLRLTTATEGQQGSFLVADLDPGLSVAAFTATYQLRHFDGSGADGSSFNFGTAPASDANMGGYPAGTFGEAGYGTDHSLTVSFDTFDNFGEAPGINIYVNGVIRGISKMMNIDLNPRGEGYTLVTVHLDGDGLDVMYGQTTVYNNFNVATHGFNPLAGDVFGLGGRTSSLTDTHSVDDLTITTTPSRVIAQPIPLPSAAWSGLGLLGALAMKRLRRLRA